MESCSTRKIARMISAYRSSLTQQEKRLRLFAVLAGALFTFVTLILLIRSQEYAHLWLCIGTFALILVPPAIEVALSCKMNAPLFIFGVCYAVGAMMGECYKLYYLTYWWDKLLHTSGGIMFAFMGAQLLYVITGDKKRFLATALFALCFSIAIAVFWEFIEYGCDVFFGKDMQTDTVVGQINSYILGSEPGLRGTIAEISKAVVNDIPLPTEGYLDIGLHDTMQDLIVETFGAIIVAVYYLIDQGRHLPYDALNKNSEGSCIAEDAETTGNQIV